MCTVNFYSILIKKICNIYFELNEKLHLDLEAKKCLVLNFRYLKKNLNGSNTKLI